MRHVHLLDTSVGSGNRGDDIIVDCARRHLWPVVRDSFLSSSSSHDGLGRYSRKLAEDADLVFLLGSNALAADYRGRRFHWRVTWRDLRALRGKVVLVGVGAHKEFHRVSRRQINFLRQVLSPRYTHSVRDELAAEILRQCDLPVVNTSCPTLWDYAHRQPVSEPNPRVACFTLTAGKPDAMDRQMIRMLADRYDRLHFWPQQPADLSYLDGLDSGVDIGIIAGNLGAYDDFLRSHRPYYVGTRLHGGIRAMSHGCRVLVVTIDNRARSLGAEVGFPILDRSRLSADLGAWLDLTGTAGPTVDGAKVDRFLQQFMLAKSDDFRSGASGTRSTSEIRSAKY